jgi:hypothetical protein
VPDVKLILICAVVGPACLVLGAMVRSRRRDHRMVVQRNPLPPLKSSLGVEGRRIDVAFGREIFRLLEDGQKVHAVALVRECTGWGLKAAAAVERLENLLKRMGS